MRAPTMPLRGMIAKIRSRPEPRERVLLYDLPRPRLALLPVTECRKLPNAARLTGDNAGTRQKWAIIGALVLGVLGALYSVTVMMGNKDLGITPEILAQIIMVPVVLAGLGWVIGERLIAPRYAAPPMYIIRKDGTPSMPDAELPRKWAVYFQNLEKLLQEADEEKTNTYGTQPVAVTVGDGEAPPPVNRSLARAVVARYDAKTMPYIEDMEDDREDIQGEMSFGQKVMIASVGGLVALSFVGVIAFSVIVGGERAKMMPAVVAPAPTPITYVLEGYPYAT